MGRRLAFEERQGLKLERLEFPSAYPDRLRKTINFRAMWIAAIGSLVSVGCTRNRKNRGKAVVLRRKDRENRGEVMLILILGARGSRRRPEILRNS